MARTTAKTNEADLKRFKDLLECAREAGVRVRVENGSFRSGFCVHQNEEMLILNRRLDPVQRCSTLARHLVQRIDPAKVENEDLREFLQDFQTSPAPVPDQGEDAA